MDAVADQTAHTAGVNLHTCSLHTQTSFTVELTDPHVDQSVHLHHACPPSRLLHPPIQGSARTHPSSLWVTCMFHNNNNNCFSKRSMLQRRCSEVAVQRLTRCKTHLGAVQVAHVHGEACRCSYNHSGGLTLQHAVLHVQSALTDACEDTNRCSNRTVSNTVTDVSDELLKRLLERI